MKLGDQTSRDVKPDFNSARAEYWIKQIKALNALPPDQRPKNWPRASRRTPAQQSFFGQVDRYMSRQSYTVSVSFGPDGRIIR